MTELTVQVIAEHNKGGWLLYAGNFPGAYTRGASLEEASAKWDAEMTAYLRWRCGAAPEELRCLPVTVQDQVSTLQICDADSDVLFDSERPPLTREEYETLKALCLRSAGDFLALYESIPAKSASSLPHRETFYGHVPRTAEEMYRHTKQVNAYYFGEIGVAADNEPDILRCRAAGFAALEQQPDFLENRLFSGSYGEDWTLRKLLRRFLWHDRIHAKAMTRMALRLWSAGEFADPFFFLADPKDR